MGNMVRQTVSHTTIRSYLKLYTTIPTAKLANFLGWSESEFRRNILALKHKSTEQVWQGGSAVDGMYTTSSDVDFYMTGRWCMSRSRRRARSSQISSSDTSISSRRSSQTSTRTARWAVARTKRQ